MTAIRKNSCPTFCDEFPGGTDDRPLSSVNQSGLSDRPHALSPCQFPQIVDPVVRGELRELLPLAVTVRDGAGLHSGAVTRFHIGGGITEGDARTARMRKAGKRFV